MDSKQRILIVDDLPANLFTLKKILEETGAEIVQATSGNDALRCTLDHEFALAILDVKMPGMNGFELAEYLRGDRKTRDLPIIFLSAAYSDESHIFQGYQSGAVDYLVKPFDPTLLVNKVGVFMQIDRQKRALMAANKELNSFSYAVSLDLRGPLHAIDGYAQMLQDGYADVLEGEGQRLLGTIRENTAQMKFLIDDLLSFARVSRRKMTSAPVRMDQLVAEVVAELEPETARRNVRFVLEDLPPARGDRMMIRIVLANLLSNALKYSAARELALIEVDGVQEGPEVIYTVKDNGMGFDMTDVDKLFEVLQRLHDPSVFKGTGIGLAIAHRVIHRHGGRIWAEGEVDRGASFHFSLPIGGGPN